MISEEAVKRNIDALEEKKNGLITKDSLRNPSNNMKFYTKSNILNQDDTEGVSALSMSTLVQKVGGIILDYVDKMKDIPYMIKSPVVSRNSAENIIVEQGAIYEPDGATKIGKDLAFGDISSLIRNTRVFIDLRRMIVSSGAKIYSEDMKTRIETEIVLLKINSSNNELTEFRAGSGDLHVEILGDEVRLDDVFILGIKIGENINPNIPYYLDLSFSIKKILSDDSIELINSTIGNTKIGKQNLNIDSNNDGAIKLFTIFGQDGLEVTILDSSNEEITTTIGDVSYRPASSYENNVIKEISVENVPISVTTKKISVWNGAANSIPYHQGKYDVYHKENREIEKVIFSNLVPIDIQVNRAFDEL